MEPKAAPRAAPQTTTVQLGPLKLQGPAAFVALLVILGAIVGLFVWRGPPRWPVSVSAALWVCFIVYWNAAARARHPIYTAMIGMFVGSAIAIGEWHAVLGVALIVIAYVRKIPLEEQSLRGVFGPAYDEYRRSSWALIPESSRRRSRSQKTHPFNPSNPFHRFIRL